MADHSRPVTGYPAPPSYPYSAPPPQPSSSSSYYYPPPQPYPYPPPRAAFLRRITAALIAAFVVAGTVVFIAWIVLRPQAPKVSLSSLSLSSFNLTPSSLLTATWLANLTVVNPNAKATLSYDHIEAYVFYRSESLTVTTLAPFTQTKKNETVISASFAAIGGYVEGKAGEGMREERRERGGLEFNLRILARVSYRAGGWKARPRFLRVYCKGLMVMFSGNTSGGTMDGGPRQCRVGL